MFLIFLYKYFYLLFFDIVKYYNITGDKMKNLIIPIILAILTGFILAKLVFNQYETEEIQTVFKTNKEVSMIQVGVYSNKKNMQENVKDFDYYIYELENGLYHVYVGITLDSANLDKLKNYYQNKGYSVYVKQMSLDNADFLDELTQYDKLIKNTDDEETIKLVSDKILKSYKEAYNN